jgi:Tfp pilus assembly protein PilX
MRKPARHLPPSRTPRPPAAHAATPVPVGQASSLPASNRAGRKPARTTPASNRGVVGVLAMMFLILFTTLALAMAVATQGNLRTASSHLRVTRAQGAVDTGLGMAAARLNEACARFVTPKGEMTPAYLTSLWSNATGASPAATVLAPADGRAEATTPNGIAAALRNLHASDATANTVAANGSNAPAQIAAPDVPNTWVVYKPIGIDRSPNGKIVTAVQISFAPPDATTGQVLSVVTGYDWDHARRRWVTRTGQQWFSLHKTVRHAILSPSRVMIGRDVQIDGPVGVRYASHALDQVDGPPVTVKSDFEGLNNTLDARLRDFYTKVLADDVDGDNRLRVGHPTEGRSIATLNTKDYDGDSAADNAFRDVTRDGMIDDYDIFLVYYDANRDGKVVLSNTMTAGTANSTLTAEFTADDALAMLIDSGSADRNRNGRSNGRFVNGVWDYSTFKDNNGDGTLDSDDVDTDDVTLGYRDGVLDYRDQYAKIRGAVGLKVARSTWEAAKDTQGVTVGDYQQYVKGAITPGKGDGATEFGLSDAELPAITDASFSAAADDLNEIADDQNQTFSAQVAAAKGQNWTPPKQAEPTPYGAPSPADWYNRPVYEGITFQNVTIPRGNNGLFKNCTFIGVTRVRAYTNNTHQSWSYYGQETRDATTGVLKLVYPPPPAESPSQLDKSYSQVGAQNYDRLPNPLVVDVDLDGDGTANDACTNTKLLSNNIRFHDCTFVGSIVADKPTVFTFIRNKIVFTGATKFVDKNPSAPNDPSENPTADEMAVLKKSSMMLPNYSVDIGTNNSPTSQDVRLTGAIIAGVLDVRGNASIDGVLMGTYSPTYGTAPLDTYGTPSGNPADFNITLGYFGPQDGGDQEGIDLSALTDLDGDGTKDIGWDSARDVNGNLIPIAGWNNVQNNSWYDNLPDQDADISPNTYVRRAIPFNGYGRVQLKWNPDLVLPDGLASALSSRPVTNSYKEGRYVADAD